ncbi:hypothetical protein BKA70DRAFT_1263324 [Coprinopsis sp. MPI-PUGE-AT-0042]|nr:hypothetical protein BKA70DRAFT_1263324 [Coprinopsis sp. MPI-PUGE-AT-0042]
MVLPIMPTECLFSNLIQISTLVFYSCVAFSPLGIGCLSFVHRDLLIVLPWAALVYWVLIDKL